MALRPHFGHLCLSQFIKKKKKNHTMNMPYLEKNHKWWLLSFSDLWHWLKSAVKTDKEKKTLPVHFTLWLEQQCGVHNNEKKCWCCSRCNAVKKVFIGTFVKRGSLLALYRKCWEPIIQRCDADSSLQVLSSLLTLCQCRSLGNGTVESCFFLLPQMR